MKITVFFIIMTSMFNTGIKYDSTPITDITAWNICFKMLENMKIHVGPGADNESTVVAYCAPERPLTQRLFNYQHRIDNPEMYKKN